MNRWLMISVTSILVMGMASVVFLPAGRAGADATKPKIKRNAEYAPVIDPDDFSDEEGDPLPIDNAYMPLAPGTTFTYESDDGEVTVEVAVTDETKEILGVTCTVVREREWEDGELLEKTDDWFAQDTWGNVWYFGEDTEEYEDGEVSTEGSWEAGVDGAQPGIVMLADPQPGDSYRQEYYEGEAEDMALVLRRNASVSVAYGDFEDCLVTKEWTPLEPGEIEHKSYAAGVGLVLVRELKGGTTRFELVSIE